MVIKRNATIMRHHFMTRIYIHYAIVAWRPSLATAERYVSNSVNYQSIWARILWFFFIVFTCFSPMHITPGGILSDYFHHISCTIISTDSVTKKWANACLFSMFMIVFPQRLPAKIIIYHMYLCIILVHFTAFFMDAPNLGYSFFLRSPNSKVLGFLLHSMIMKLDYSNPTRKIAYQCKS